MKQHLMRRLLRALEYLPLSVFLFYRSRIDTSIPQNWLGPFYAGGFMAAAGLLLPALRKTSADRVFMGINLYLLTGALAIVTGQNWLTDLNANMQASGMLLWIGLVGVITTRATPTGFIGKPHAEMQTVRRFSYYLLIITVAAYYFSYLSQGRPFMSDFLPFAGLLAARQLLRGQMETTT